MHAGEPFEREIFRRVTLSVAGPPRDFCRCNRVNLRDKRPSVFGEGSRRFVQEAEPASFRFESRARDGRVRDQRFGNRWNTLESGWVKLQAFALPANGVTSFWNRRSIHAAYGKMRFSPKFLRSKSSGKFFFFIWGSRVASTTRSLATCWNFLFISGLVVGSPLGN